MLFRSASQGFLLRHAKNGTPKVYSTPPVTNATNAEAGKLCMNCGISTMANQPIATYNANDNHSGRWLKPNDLMPTPKTATAQIPTNVTVRQGSGREVQTTGVYVPAIKT